MRVPRVASNIFFVLGPHDEGRLLLMTFCNLQNDNSCQWRLFLKVLNPQSYTCVLEGLQVSADVIPHRPTVKTKP